MNMNKPIASLILALTLACPLVGFSQSDLEKDPAYLPIDKYVNLKVIKPEVNVNIPRFLLKDVLSGLSSPEAKAGTNNPDATAKAGADLADLVKDVKLIRVVVIDEPETNRSDLDKGMKKLQAELESKWTPIVVVPDGNVNVYAMGDPSGESMSGLALLIYDDGDAVIGNIVGHVSIGKLMKLASQSGQVPKDLLQKLQGFGSPSAGQPAAKKVKADQKDKPDDEATTNPPAIALSSVTNSSAFLSDVAWTDAEVGWGEVTRNHFWLGEVDRSGVALRLNEKVFDKGLYAHASSRYVFPLDGRWKTFTAVIGLQDGAADQGSAIFTVRGDGRELYRSRVLRIKQVDDVKVDVSQVKELELVAEGGEGHNFNSWAVWADPKVER